MKKNKELAELEENIRKAVPYFFGVVQLMGSAVFTFALSIALLACAVIGGFQIHSLSARVDRLEAERQEMAVAAAELQAQRREMANALEQAKRERAEQGLNKAVDNIMALIAKDYRDQAQK